MTTHIQLKRNQGIQHDINTLWLYNVRIGWFLQNPVRPGLPEEQIEK